MPWWEPVPAYLLGSAVLLALSLVGAVWHRERYRRAAVSAVFEAAAELVAAAPGAEAEQARHRLALASAAARQAVAGYRLRPAAGPLHAAWSVAREAAATAAERTVPPPFAGSGAAPSPESTGDGGGLASGSATAGVVSASDWAGGGADSAPRSGGRAGAPGAAENGGDQTSDVAEIARETAPGSGGGAVAGLARAGAGGRRGEPVAADRVDGWRRRAREVRAGDLGRFPAVPPVPPRPAWSVLRRATSTAALWVADAVARLP